MELAQIRAMIVYFVMYKFITVEAKSQRYLEKLEEADKFEWVSFSVFISLQDCSLAIKQGIIYIYVFSFSPLFVLFLNIYYRER